MQGLIERFRADGLYVYEEGKNIILKQLEEHTKDVATVNEIIIPKNEIQKIIKVLQRICNKHR